jgi:uncharacterized protein (DUF983 family)
MTVQVAAVLGRGLRRRCPNCGRGPLFRGWLAMYERCPECRLVYLRNHGDTWFFWILGDRIPIAVAVAAIYFGFRASTWPMILAFSVVILGPLVGTMPHRQGVAVALAYLSRVYLRDPSDELPPFELT